MPDPNKPGGDNITNPGQPAPKPGSDQPKPGQPTPGQQPNR